MKTEDIFNEWEKDSHIDISALDRASLDIPVLHHKYYKIYTGEKYAYKLLENEYKVLYRQKVEHLGGSLDYDEMRELNWEPNPRKILKQDMSTYVDSDQDIIKMNLKLAAQEEKVKLLESIIKIISNRGFAIKSAIDFLKFKNGM